MSSVRPRKSTVAEHLAGTSDAWHGKITPAGPFQPEAGRYHLYIGLFCPFAHRVNLVRHLLELQDLIPASIVRPYPKGDEHGWPGWKFAKDDNEYTGATVDELYGSEYLHELYFKADKEYQGRYSVPMLWDTKTKTIVNNESTELLRDLQGAFEPVLSKKESGDAAPGLPFYPRQLSSKIDEIADWMQRDLNTGVYKAGFADKQEDYDKQVLLVFAALNKLEKIVAEHKGPFVLGELMTELDLRLYPTLIRFDTVYVQHFKCNLGTIRHDYPQLNNWMKGLYWNVKGFRETTDFKHIKENYTKSHSGINPKAITPRGPFPDVEPGFQEDFGRVAVGGVRMEEVVELEKKLP